MVTMSRPAAIDAARCPSPRCSRTSSAAPGAAEGIDRHRELAESAEQRAAYTVETLERTEEQVAELIDQRGIDIGRRGGQAGARAVSASYENRLLRRDRPALPVDRSEQARFEHAEGGHDDGVGDVRAERRRSTPHVAVEEVVPETVEAGGGRLRPPADRGDRLDGVAKPAGGEDGTGGSAGGVPLGIRKWAATAVVQRALSARRRSAHRSDERDLSGR